MSVTTLPCELDIELALLWSCWKEKHRNPSASTVASRFARFKSSWLQCGGGGHTAIKVYKTRMTDLDDLKHHVRTEWAKLDHTVIAAAVHQWRRRLSACVKAGGGHFEHCFCLRHCFCSDNCDLSCCRWPVEQLHANMSFWFNCSCQLWFCALQYMAIV